MFVPIGGIEQWIEIAGNAGNPVLLYLHGGPGGSSRPASEAWAPWSEYFNVVHWEQRGAGRTFAQNGEAGCGRLTIERMLKDGIEVAEYLTSSLGLKKILLVGHSWGAVLGVHMIRSRPDLFSAYVGTGILVNFKENEQFNYARLVAQAESAANHEAIATLRKMGPPPFAERASIRVMRELADKLSLATGDSPQPRPPVAPTNFTSEDRDSLLAGFAFSGSQLFPEISNVNLLALGTDFSIPMFCFMGSADQQTPVELAEHYFEMIAAPHKECVRFDGCHHFVVINRPIEFLKELVERVLPFAATDRT